MGTWGYRARDNDASADGIFFATHHAVVAAASWLGVRAAKPRTMRWASVTSQGLWEQFGLVEGLLGKGLIVPNRLLRVCLRGLKQIRRDSEWFLKWREPNLARRAVDAYIALLEGVLAAHKAHKAERDKLRTKRPKERRHRISRMRDDTFGWADWPLSAPKQAQGYRMEEAPHYRAFQKEMAAIERSAMQARARRRYGKSVSARRRMRGKVQEIPPEEVRS